MRIIRMYKVITLFIAAVLLLPAVAVASGGAHLYKAPININDKESLRRGAKAFGDYCYSCHAASFMRFNRIAKDLEMPEDEVREMLIHTYNKKGAPTKIGDLMEVSMTDDYAENAFGTAVPDLSLAARARGADWIYTYLRGFYVDSERPTGFNNSVFPDVGMPHVLWSLQGLQAPVYKTSKHGDIEVETLESFEQIQAGKLSRVEYDMFLGDLTNFMVYLAEPVQVERRSMGWKVLLFLIVLFGFAYALKKEYWKDVH
ncbi:Ubiquinol-cytochrome C reductase, cytochrome C1 subunit [hydrothermal vent metagenome]|uniref:Ubiquinol-cytochrome C reductase, cytochrome C1 subunit n=1 Tax=hydrothermal vent metagenome TaxID=652676 RepID=A0A3B0WYE8_9ZZZZ